MRRYRGDLARWSREHSPPTVERWIQVARGQRALRWDWMLADLLNGTRVLESDMPSRTPLADEIDRWLEETA